MIYCIGSRCRPKIVRSLINDMHANEVFLICKYIIFRLYRTHEVIKRNTTYSDRNLRDR
jgi:hypothetical protein